MDADRFTGKSKFDPSMTQDDILDLLDKTLKHGDESSYMGKAVFEKRLKGSDNVYRNYRATVNEDGTVQSFHPLD